MEKKSFFRFSLLSLAAAASLSTAWGADDFTVEKRKNRSLGDVTDVIVTYKGDGLTLTDIVVNRGNCALLSPYGQPLQKPIDPVSMKFGSTVKVGAAGFCNLLEVQIHTNKGVFTSSFNK